MLPFKKKSNVNQQSAQKSATMKGILCERELINVDWKKNQTAIKSNESH